MVVVVVSGFALLVLPVLNVNPPVALVATTGVGAAPNVIFGPSAYICVYTTGVNPNDNLGASFFPDPPVAALDRRHHPVLPASHTVDNPVRVIRQQTGHIITGLNTYVQG